MFFVVESGSTKSDWVLIDGENKHEYYNTMGFNPYFHHSEFICEEIFKHKEINAIRESIKGVYFYGAGCSSSKLNEIIKKGLNKVFVNAEILVEHDLLACAYSTYSGVPQISCILGTGSNSCFFDGKNLFEVRPALGYILGDEGSGSYFGKKLLIDFLYGRLPKEIESSFNQAYNLDKDGIVQKVYKEPNANVYIASFMPFIEKNKSHDYFNRMLVAGFKDFIDVHVTCYENYQNTEVNFVGSVSSLFEKQLKQAADEMGISIGTIIRKRVDALVDYHVKYVLNNSIA